MEIIKRLTIISNPTRVFEVGTELDGREVIEIRQVGSEYEDHVHSEYVVLDEDGGMIAVVENAPVIVDYQRIAVDDEKDDPRYRIA